MKYRFILTYQATDSETTYTRTCFPLHGDDLSISIDRAEGEWYYTRNLDGKLVFVNVDYAWITACEFDGTFTLNIQESRDGGATYYDYFTGTFSRASLEIDEDNHTATLNGLKEGIADLIKNGKKEEYDLMKLIPDSEAKTVQGQVHPALALIDYNSTTISQSDLYCNAPTVGAGYKSNIATGWDEKKKVVSDVRWTLQKIFAEVLVETDDTFPARKYKYCGYLNYNTKSNSGEYFTSVEGRLDGPGVDNYLKIQFDSIVMSDWYQIRMYGQWKYQQGYPEYQVLLGSADNTYFYSPSYLEGSNTTNHIEKVTVYIHYIKASLLSDKANGPVRYPNVLDTGDYYQGQEYFHGGGLDMQITSRTTEQPNGHRLVPGSADYGGIPKYFAPPDDSGLWIPIAEYNWQYASMWYKITPSVNNGMLSSDRIGTWSWYSFDIGTCIRYLLNRITNGQVVFAEMTDCSQFLYGNPNPVEDYEPFQWLVTQKSNVMRPTVNSAARCPVRLEWFLELLKNAFNCYYWFEKRNDGKYDFRIEHVEYFRRGGAYNRNLADQLDLTVLKPRRNFLRNGQPAKRYADQTNKYTFDLDGMVEKYTYSWQGDGGSDDFKGNPMYFRAGWIEKGTSEDHQVDNIFADLGWLMLNAGTDTASSKNYDGIFLFGGYRRAAFFLRENVHPTATVETIQNNLESCDMWVTIPEGDIVTVSTDASTISYTGTGKPQWIPIDLPANATNIIIVWGDNYADITLHRIHARSGNVFNVPNVADLLRPTNYLQNGVLAWPWLQNEYLHYDIPAAKWTYLKDDYTDNQSVTWLDTGTIKMVKKQNLAVVPIPDASTEDAIMGIMGAKTGLGIGIIDNAKINLSSRNAEMTIIYDINPQNN